MHSRALSNWSLFRRQLRGGRANSSRDVAEEPLQTARFYPLVMMSLGSAVISLLLLLRAASTAAPPSSVEAAVSSLYSSRPFPHFELDGDWTNPARSLTQYVGPSHLPEINHHVRVYTCINGVLLYKPPPTFTSMHASRALAMHCLTTPSLPSPCPLPAFDRYSAGDSAYWTLLSESNPIRPASLRFAASFLPALGLAACYCSSPANYAP